ncbi:WhiB family transcriptional regulator [Microbacterium esteraromaticum]|uniref:WhiB family transcriptional regulator n=1 Tax=Microbacterium esteraromaticum TaxID=57043 RepID=UPI001C95AFA8|nr:WhiB family transcriptional regulator [Microbacterium esteraromaticum]MBY6061613.1 WhiB family transcriptional regulator [Microbacterium esteraromaticum]
MGMDVEPVWLTYVEAAKRVKSSTRTVKRWHREGMAMEWRTDDVGQRFRVVEESVLLSWWRDRLKASPVHFYRMRKAAIERGETPPPIPEQFRGRPRAGIGPESLSICARTGGTASGGTEGAGTPPVCSDRLLDVLAELPEFKGQAEHAALTAAMEDEPPGCDGLDVFTHDRFDDPEQTEMMRGICRDCPLLDLCAAFAAAGRPVAGMWAGKTPAEIRGGDRRYEVAA